MVGVLPWLHHRLPDEEGPTLDAPSGAHDGLRVAILCGPYASNLDEFVALQQVANVQFVGQPCSLVDFDLVVLPGSKHVAADLAWLRSTGLAAGVAAAAGAGVRVLGICGGLQALGRALDDPDGVEGAARGLGLLNVDTTYASAKRTVATTAEFARMPLEWEWLSGRSVRGYEIRHGVTTAFGAVDVALSGGRGFVSGNVLGIAVHGVLEDRDVLGALTGHLPAALDAEFDALADAVEAHLDVTWLAEHLSVRA
jgi:adenosylcobyric acid synthase